MSESQAQANRVIPSGYICGWAAAGVEPTLFGLGPVPAVRKVLQQTSVTLDEIALIELNEAFASSTIAVMRDLELDPEKVNVNGGAIALGHPVGATGLVLAVKLLNELKRRRARYGLVMMCVGNGQGMAMLLEAVGVT
jgi:acetyl-CoA C-acetyltransferase